MNALGWHLIFSLFFVIGTMVEFAVVLIVKQKLEWDKGEAGVRSYGIKFETTSPAEKSRRATNVVKIDIIEGTVHDSEQEEGDGEIENPHSRIKKLGFWKASSVINKIDFFAFFLFIFAYLVFNCAYWFHYMQL